MNPNELDKIVITDLLTRGHIGVPAEERVNPQDLLINLTLYADVRRSGESDNVKDTVDYSWVSKEVVKLVEKNTRHTVEALAADIANFCLNIPLVQTVRIRVEKPHRVRFTQSVGVEIERSRAQSKPPSLQNTTPESIEYQRGEYQISTNPALLQLNIIHDYLSNHSYWAGGRTIEVVQASLETSLCFGVYRENEQVGFARIVTDRATFAWLCDVFILPEERGKGLGKWLVQCVTAHPELKSIRRIVLATQDAHGLYCEYGGFTPMINPERWMERFNPNS